MTAPEGVPLVERTTVNCGSAICDLRDGVEELEGGTAQFLYCKEEVETQEPLRLDIFSRYDGSLSPARTLPPELLSLVFTFLPNDSGFVGAKGTESSNRKLVFVTNIVRVSHVSRHWRELAIGNPSLWDRIPVDVLPDYPSHNLSHQGCRRVYSDRIAARTRMVEAYLSRSAGLPITFKINVKDPIPNEPLNELLPLIDTLRSARWKHVTVILSSSHPNSLFCRIFPVPAHNLGTLESMQVKCLPLFTRQNPSLPTPLFAMTGDPFKLRCLDIDHPSYFLSTPTTLLGLDWPSLTDLTIGSIYNAEHALKALSVCKWLIKCTILAGGRPLRPPSPSHLEMPRSVTLPNLRTIIVRDEWIPVSLPKLLVLPTLESFEAVVDRFEVEVCHPTDELITALPLFVTEFGARLTDITFAFAHLSSTVIKYCLENIPNVRSLTMVAPKHELMGASNSAAS